MLSDSTYNPTKNKSKTPVINNLIEFISVRNLFMLDFKWTVIALKTRSRCVVKQGDNT